MTRGDLKTKCDECRKDVGKFKHLKKCNSGFFCRKCISERRLKHREFLKRDILGIRTKEQQKKDWKEVRKEKEKRTEKLRKIVLPSKPNIKSIARGGRRISALGIYITKDERLFQYHNLIRQGLTSIEANKRIKNLCKQMVIIKEKLKAEIKTEKELNKRFKEEWAKLLERES